MPQRRGKQRNKKHLNKLWIQPKQISPNIHKLQINRKQLLLYGYMRKMHDIYFADSMIEIPTDLINLCLLFYYIPYYSANINIHNTSCEKKIFVLKQCQFESRAANKLQFRSRRNDIINYNQYQYYLSLNKFPNELNPKRTYAIDSISLYHELISSNDQIMDINVATFTNKEHQKRVSRFSVDFRLHKSASDTLSVTMNAKILRIGCPYYQSDPPYAKYTKYIDFNPHNTMITKVNVAWCIKDLSIYSGINCVFSNTFCGNYWCLKYDYNGYIALRLLCLPPDIERIKVKCVLNSKNKKTQMMSYNNGKNECKFKIVKSDANTVKNVIRVYILEVYDVHRKISHKQWIKNGFVLHKHGTQFVRLDS